MAAEAESSNGIAGPPPTEQTPLLRDSRDGSSAEAQNGEAVASEEASAVKEPTAKELILILGSIWLGVFLAALGMCDYTPLSAQRSLTPDVLL